MSLPPPGGLVTMAESWTFPAPAAGLARTARAVLAVALVGVLALAFPESARAQAPSPSVCDRTPEVRDALVGRVNNISDCADVTQSHLTQIHGTLSLNGEGITTLKSSDFNGLSSIDIINLNNNALTELPEGIFDDTREMRELSIGNNSLRDLPSGIFDQLKQLISLELQANRFTGLPANAFAQLGDLVRLNLSENPITSLPAGVFDDLVGLSKLELTGNSLRSLGPDVFRNMRFLQ